MVSLQESGKDREVLKKCTEDLSKFLFEMPSFRLRNYIRGCDLEFRWNTHFLYHQLDLENNYSNVKIQDDWLKILVEN